MNIFKSGAGGSLFLAKAGSVKVASGSPIL